MTTMTMAMGVSQGKWTPRPKTLGIFGLVFFSTGIFLLVPFPNILDKILDNQLVLSESSVSTSIWSDLPVPVYMEFYMFNWTNPEDFNKAGVKPILEELGPYVYREHRKKVIDQWNSHNGTVTFRQNRTWHFEPSLSKGHPDDVVTTVNIVAASAEFACDHLDMFSKLLIDSTIQSMDTKPFIKVKVGEILFDGYDDPMLSLASLLPPGMFPVQIPMFKFGWFHTRNGSADGDGVFNMKTGAGDLSRLGELTEWNYKNHTGIFKSNCGAVNGSAGELFPPHANMDQPIYGFSSEICRSIRLDFDKQVNFDGIKGYRYTPSKSLFDDEQSNPDNWCFCSSKNRAQCPPSGVLELSGCKWGAAAYLSFPHFYQADPSYRKAFVGMKPDAAQHETFIELEPKLRLPIRGTAAFQINILIEEHEGFSLFEGVPRTLFPTMWFRQRASLDRSMGFVLKILINLPTMMRLLSCLLIAIGLVSILFFVYSLLGKSPIKSQINYSAVPSRHPL